jgi:Xaa-Pro aminopeptidase
MRQGFNSFISLYKWISIPFFSLCFIFNSVAEYDFTAPSPWPDIRKERLQTILPAAMKIANVDAWLVICRENNNDPLAKHVGCENAGKTAVFLFYFDLDNKSKKQFVSVAFSPEGEATALKDISLLDEVYAVPRNEEAITIASERVKQFKFSRIAINMSDKDPQADGISFTQYIALTAALGQEYSQRLVSADTLIQEYLSIKLPAEVDIMREAAKLTAKWQIEAYQQIEVGKTKDSDVAKYLKQKMREYGVTDAWAPTQNPNVVSGTDRGHSHATDRVIQHGDVIQTDFGIRVFDTWVTDIQRFAYVLRPNETQVPKDIAHYWESAKQGRHAAFNAMKPGATGKDVDAAQRAVMVATNSKHVMWSTGHPVGYVAHDSGPSLSSTNKNGTKQLKAGMTFAFDGFHSWIMDDGQPKTISVEEMVVITEKGAQYLIPPQQDLILVR